MIEKTTPDTPTLSDTPNLLEATEMTHLEHCGMVAVVGRTNSGKSTLVNHIIGEKISIVSPVVQTTRNVVRGVLTDARGQLVLVDTPGLHKSQSTLSSLMNKQARAAAEGVDAVLLVVDASKEPQLEDEGWMRRLVRTQGACFILLNKVDVASKAPQFHTLWERLVQEQLQSTNPKAASIVPPVPQWFSASAKTGEGMEALTTALFAALPPGPLLFDADTLTDYPRKLAVADIIREKCFLSLRDELPHSIGVKVEDIVTKENGHKVVRATLYVQRPNHKGILLGAKGRTLRTIARQAEKELSTFFEVPTVTELWIKVEPKWDENYFLLRQIGHV